MAGAEVTRTCPWCSAAVPDEATKCPSCGAAVAQREDLGDVGIPGVTMLDPGMQASHSTLEGVMRVQNAATRTGQHFHLMLPGGDIVETVAGAALYGRAFAAVAQAGLDLLSTPDDDTSNVGRPSEAALLQAEWLDEQERTVRQGGGQEPADASVADTPLADAPPADAPLTDTAVADMPVAGTPMAETDPAIAPESEGTAPTPHTAPEVAE